MPNEPREQGDDTGDESFADILKEFENAGRAAAGKSKSKARSKPVGPKRLQGTVVSVSGDFVLIDYGAKSEGVIPVADLLDAQGNLSVKRGDTFDVTVTGYNREDMATLSRVAGPRPRDWDGLLHAFETKEIIA